MNDKMILTKLLQTILEETFEPKKEYFSFKVEIVPKELKSKHGHYVPNDRKIEVFNLARSPGCTMLTCIHELAHHVEFMDLGTTGHKRSFYMRFHSLLLTALSKGIITSEDLEEDSKDSKDFSKLLDYFGPINHWSFELTEEAKKRYVCIKQAFRQKDSLKERGYRYHPKSQAWIKEFPSELYANREAKMIQDTFKELEVTINRVPTTLFSLNYYVAVHGAFEQREILKENGYRWGAYGIKKAWVKKVPTDLFYQEEAFLKSVRLTYKKVTPIKII